MAYKTPKDVQKRKEAKKRHILETGAKIFAVRGYHETTVKDIVEEAGISVGVFYFYFTNKEDIFETLYGEMTDMYLDVMTEAAETISENPAESVARAITLALLSFQNNSELARIMLIESVGLNRRFELKRQANNARFLNIIEEILKTLHEKKIIVVSDLHVAALAFMGSIYTAIIDWLQSDGKKSAVESAYPITVYNLQAIKLDFKEENIKKIINKTIKEKQK